MTKLKSKETEIKLLQERVLTWNEKFKPRSQQQQDKSDSECNTENRTEGQLLAELALNEIKLGEMTNRLDDQQEQLREMEQQLENERQRRRQLETFYLNSLNSNNNGNYHFHRMLIDADDNDMNLIHNKNIEKNGKLRSNMDSFWQQQTIIKSFQLV
ncbi:hypothetical protein BLA29_005288 [Euroglyphus maynei]|uniref:Uncharacterized protein n=1 Tax=Euroglyphus maynei TaxID=6958 RepID=A0A1Y3ASG3_EURMA|nr:hypothetical protein BLA29_005288 [Euroglyphus maynei]